MSSAVGEGMLVGHSWLQTERLNYGLEWARWWVTGSAGPVYFLSLLCWALLGSSSLLSFLILLQTRRSWCCSLIASWFGLLCKATYSPGITLFLSSFQWLGQSLANTMRHCGLSVVHRRRRHHLPVSNPPSSSSPAPLQLLFVTCLLCSTRDTKSPFHACFI